MGAGIAQLAASAGHPTCLHDVEAGALDAAHQRVAAALQRRVDRGKLSAEDRAAVLRRLSVSAELATAVARAELVIEAVPERLNLKVSVLGAARDAAPARALLASNTSSLSITELGALLHASERTVGMHFFNPAVAMPLVEIVRGMQTTDETLARCRVLAEGMGKTPIIVSDSPGFATSRLGLVIGAEAIRMLESGVASVQDIDRAMELGYRHPMGPLKLGDLVGLDVRLAILEHLHHEIGEQFRPPPLLRRMVRAGWLGKKTGRGFYRWTESGAIPTDPLSAGP